MSGFQVLIGGPTTMAKFPLDNLLRLEDRVNGDKAEVTVEINPNKIILSDNSGVSSWLPITTQFRDIHVSEGSTVRWEGKEVLTRFRLKSNLLDDGTSKPSLLLEAVVLPSGTWAAVPLPDQITLSHNASSAIKLWSKDCAWISPLPTNKLPTVAGIARQTFEVVLPNELTYRWYIQAILRRLDEGSTLSDRDRYNAYIRGPFLTKLTNPVTCWLPDPYYHIVGDSGSGTSNQVPLPCAINDNQLTANIEAARKMASKATHPAQRNHPLPAKEVGAVSSEPVSAVAGVEVAARDETLGQEVTQYCPMACGWSSYKSYDKAMLDPCIKQLTLHLLTDHGMSSSNNDQTASNSKGDKSSREYTAATKLRTVTDVMDDATHNLCSARFFAAPLDIKVLGMKMPICTSPINTVVDLSHIGVDVTNPDTLRKIQNRATVSFKLRDFSEPNLRSHQNPGDELIAVQHTKDHLYMGKKVKNLDDPMDCVKAFFNYCILAQNFHVLDWSPQALMKVVLEKYSAGLTTVEMFERLFEKFIHENAVRAQKRATPLTYQEILTKYNTTIAPPAMDLSVFQNIVRKEMQIAEISSNYQEKDQEREISPSPLKRAKLTTKEDYCPNFNHNKDKPYCSNPESEDGKGCIVNGRQLRHACNRKVGSRFCNSSNHNFYNH